MRPLPFSPHSLPCNLPAAGIRDASLLLRPWHPAQQVDVFGSLSLADLMRYPSRSQITHQACEEGWSFIAEWTGVALSEVLQAAGVRPERSPQTRWPALRQTCSASNAASTAGKMAPRGIHSVT